MSNSIKPLFLLGLVGLAAACTTRTVDDTRMVQTGTTMVEEFVIVEPEPISVEPVFTGKYK